MKKYKNKTNKKAFTLIELLAVIVILGVLMITAIPAVTQAIAKSRRDTYATNAKKIIDAVRTSVLNEEFVVPATENTPETTCQLPGIGQFLRIDLMKSPSNTDSKTVIEQLLERGGTKSSFNQDYALGYVWISNVGKANSTIDKYVYYIFLTDKGGNGTKTLVAENDMTRNKIYIKTAPTDSFTGNPGSSNPNYTCEYSG